MNIAQFPLPVLTGIGHERDETIADLVAYKSLKTPTAVAEFLLDKLTNFSNHLKQLQEKIEQTLRWIIQQDRMALQQKSSDLKYLVNKYLVIEDHTMTSFHASLKSSIGQGIKNEQNTILNSSNKLKYLWRGLFEHQRANLSSISEKNKRITRASIKHRLDSLEGFERSLRLLSPEKVLARGYSISYLDGKSLKSVEYLNIGTRIETRIADGIIESTINKVKNSKEQ